MLLPGVWSVFFSLQKMLWFLGMAFRREGCRISRCLASEMGIESMYDE